MLNKLAMVAGETSGDLLAAHLLGGMQTRWPELAAPGAAFGIGGPNMQARGFAAQWPSEKLAVRGYVEVLKHYREIVGIRKRLAAQLSANPSKPQLFIGVDAPDFNLDLELQLKAQGIKTVQFISPAIWAWRPERIEKIKRACNAVLCIFPFEPELYQGTGVQATYVGHPLAQAIPLEPDRSAARTQLNLPQEAPVLALLPGSRAAEVQYLVPRMFAAVSLLWRSHPSVQVLVPCVPTLRHTIAAHAAKAGLQHELGQRLHLLQGLSHAALAACDVTLIASGTATLEAALFKRPMVVVYNMHPISWWLTQRKRLQPWVGLPNILSNSFVVPELLQDQATPQAMASKLRDWFDDAPKREQTAQQFIQLHHQLKRDTVTLACDAIQAIL